LTVDGCTSSREAVSVLVSATPFAIRSILSTRAVLRSRSTRVHLFGLTDGIMSDYLKFGKM